MRASVRAVRLRVPLCASLCFFVPLCEKSSAVPIEPNERGGRKCGHFSNIFAKTAAFSAKCEHLVNILSRIRCLSGLWSENVLITATFPRKPSFSLQNVSIRSTFRAAPRRIRHLSGCPVLPAQTNGNMPAALRLIRNDCRPVPCFLPCRAPDGFPIRKTVSLRDPTR